MKTGFSRMCIRASLNLGIFFAMLLSFTSIANAQLYGTGVAPGVQACPYRQEIGDEAEGIAEDIRDRKENLKELVEQQKEVRANKRELERKLKSTKEMLSRRGIQGEYLDKIIDHIENMRSCSEYEGWIRSAAFNDSEAENNSRMPAADKATVPSPEEQSTTQAQGNAPNSTAPYLPRTWSEAVCDRDQKGVIRVSACGVLPSQVGKSAFNAEICRTNLKAYQESHNKLRQTTNELAMLDGQISSIKGEISALKGTLKQSVREHQKELRAEATEGGCVDCAIASNGYSYQKPKTDWGGVVTNLGLGIASIYFGNKMQEYTSEQYARIGKTSETYPAYGYGMGFGMAAIGALAGGGGGQIYGAMNGGVGAGGFGCATGVGQGGAGGAFGYPPGFYPPPPGGGMYSGYPAGGYPGGFAAGGQFGVAVGGYPAAGGYPGGFAGGGFQGGGFQSGGYPAGGFQGGGYPGGFAAGGQVGFAGGGYPAGGFQSGGYPAGGFQGGGYPGGFAAGGQVGFAGGGYPAGGFQGGGFQGGGYPGGFAGGGYQGGGYPGGFAAGGQVGLAGGGYPGGYPAAGGFASGGYPGGFAGGGQGGFQGGGYPGGGYPGGGYQGGGYGGAGQAYARMQENAYNNQRVLYGLRIELDATYQRYIQAEQIVRSGGYLGFGGSYSGGVGFGGGGPVNGPQPAGFQPGVPSVPTGGTNATTPSTR